MSSKEKALWVDVSQGLCLNEKGELKTSLQVKGTPYIQHKDKESSSVLAMSTTSYDKRK